LPELLLVPGGEALLRSDIEKHGCSGVCFYCGADGKTFSIGEMASRVETAFDKHFYRTPNVWRPTNISSTRMVGHESFTEAQRRKGPIGHGCALCRRSAQALKLRGFYIRHRIVEVVETVK
jgi:hypothetical protein